MFRESCRTIAQHLLEPLAVDIGECGTVPCADADAEEIEGSVEVGFPVEGKSLPLREAAEVSCPFLVVRRWSSKVWVRVLVACAREHRGFLKPVGRERPLQDCFPAGGLEMVEE